MTPRNAMKFLAGCACVAAVWLASTASAQTANRPNILVIWGDDIGTWNVSHNNRGMMGYQTPNIDRIAREGVGFTDYYAQPLVSGQKPSKLNWLEISESAGATVLSARACCSGIFSKSVTDRICSSVYSEGSRCRSFLTIATSA